MEGSNIRSKEKTKDVIPLCCSVSVSRKPTMRTVVSLVGSGEATVAGILGAVFKKGGSPGIWLSERFTGAKQKLCFMERNTVERALGL